MKKVIILDAILILVNLFLYITGNLDPIDDLVYNLIYICDFTTIIFKFVTSLSNTIPLCILFILTIIILYKKDYKKEAKNLTILFAISAIIMLVLKEIMQRPRPNINRLIPITGFSYPSGHSLMSMVFYGFIAYIIHQNYNGKNKNLWITLSLMAIPLIGFSRIYLGVHYFSDVVMGFSIGILILLTNHIILKREKNKINNNN